MLLIIRINLRVNNNDIINADKMRATIQQTVYKPTLVFLAAQEYIMVQFIHNISLFRQPC